MDATASPRTYSHSSAAEAADRDIVAMGAALDSVGVALCLFDADDRIIMWNGAFPAMFPEHDRRIYAGEAYADTVRRFYGARPIHDGREHTDRFAVDVSTRHHAPPRLFSDGRRVRVWTPAQAQGTVAGLIPALLDLPDGVMVLDAAGRIIAVNAEFSALYDVASPEHAVGVDFRDIVRSAWLRGADPTALPDRLVAMLDNARFANTAFEVELPGHRWRRVVGRRLPDGTGYVSHSDISVFKQQQRELQAAYAKLDALAVTDGLTGLANRRRFQDALDEEARRAARSGMPLSLLLIDIDQFKLINDRLGHAAGDAVLRAVAHLLGRRIYRPGDLAARYGGDQFVVLLPGNDTEGAVELAEALRLLIAKHDAPGFGGSTTISIGAACVVVGEGGRADPPGLIAAADRALSLAKSRGRNQVVAAPESYRLREPSDEPPPLQPGLSIPS
ncbi:MAG: diguanylate cyclase [Gemmatimonadaceae bacterium]|nr:diguanylate cyclase [Acetobacteraceae bacterium]